LRARQFSKIKGVFQQIHTCASYNPQKHCIKSIP